MPFSNPFRITCHATDVTPPLPVEWVSNIHVIHLQSLLHREILVLGMFLRELGPSLTHLYLACPHFLRHTVHRCSDDMYYSINLGHNTNLRSIHFSQIRLNIDHLSGFYGRTPLVWMQMVIAQINSPQMEELRFLIEVNFFNDLNQIDWNMLAHIFAQPHFSRLKKIHFDIERVGCSDPGSPGIWIRRNLPACDARGILSTSSVNRVVSGHVQTGPDTPFDKFIWK